MRACELTAGRTDVESALLARGPTAMILLSITVVGVKNAVIVDCLSSENCGLGVVRLICSVEVHKASDERILTKSELLPRLE